MLSHTAAGARTFARLGPLEVRLAQTAAEVGCAQRLRYQVFFEERRAAIQFGQRDSDGFDRLCDHLLVIDHASDGAVVGTTRLLRHDVAQRHRGFYSAAEFEIGELLARHRMLRFLEIGRSCVLAPYRNRRTMELLWHGIAAFTERDRCDVMFGCASLDGTDPGNLALPLSFLHHHALSPSPWRARPVADRRIDMNMMSADSIDTKAALRALPPLIKGYLRLGATVGDGAVIDHAFGTTDVLIMLPMASIKQRYYAHFGSKDVPDAA